MWKRLTDWWKARKPWQKKLLIGAGLFLVGFIAGVGSGD